jgi:hypothetical protein
METPPLSHQVWRTIVACVKMPPEEVYFSGPFI